jgi:hypothetical protein
MEKYDFFFDKVLSFNGNEDPEYEYLKCKEIFNFNFYDIDVQVVSISFLVYLEYYLSYHLIH